MAVLETPIRRSSFTTSNVMFYWCSKGNCPLVPDCPQGGHCGAVICSCLLVSGLSSSGLPCTNLFY